MRPTFVLRIAAAGLLGAGLVAGPSTAAAAAEPAPLKAASAPWLWPRSGLEAVSATGPDDVWAVGYQGYQGIDWSVPFWGAGTIHVLPPKPAVVRWNGSSWRTYDPPGAGGDAVIQDVEARTPSDVWVAGTLRPHGQQGAPYLAHWNGTGWQQVQGPAENCAPRNPAPDSAGAWFSCGNDLYRWQDGQWTVQETGRPPNACCVSVNEISVLSDDAAWAAATWGLLKWDGQTWSEIPGFGDGFRFTHVLAVSADEVWAAGVTNTGGSTSERFLVRWDGQSWQEAPRPAHQTMIKTGDGTLWGLQEYLGELYRLDGSSWTQVAPPTPSDGQVTGGTAVPGSPALWLVGKTPNVPVVINNR